MRCSQCEFDNRETARFCAQCGVRLERRCPACGALGSVGSKFCDECGAALDAAAASAPASPTQATPAPQAPERYTPPHLVERILRSRAALEGERKQVTILFADTKGSTELVSTLDPEEASRVLDPALRTMMDAVHRYEGTVNRMQGDGLMAMFGAPIAHEDHALRACHAALAMQRTLGEDGIPSPAGRALELRVGLHTGEVVVRAINNDLSMSYDTVGLTAHLARAHGATSEWMRWRYSTHLFASLGELWLARGKPEKAEEFAGQ